MKKKLVALLLALSVFALYGCGGGGTTPPAQEPAGEEQQEAPATSEAGTVAISGSTSTEKVVKALADEFMAQNPDITVTYESIGSSGGVKNAIDGVSAIGTASREIEPEEESEGIDVLDFAYDGIAAIVHPDNEVADITMEQLTQIYNGEVTNWSELGGADVDIVVVSREDGSGTRGAFEELLDLETIVETATIAEGNGNVQTTVAGNPNAIGYVSFTFINDTVKALQVAGIEPTPEDVIAGDYELSRPFNMVYFEDQLDENAKMFLEFIQSDEGKDIITENGAIVE